LAWSSFCVLIRAFSDFPKLAWRSDVILNLKEKKKPFSFLLDLLGTVAEVLTMCCFFGAAWMHSYCIGMIRVGSYFLDWLSAAAEQR
jgi:hypothetical protein